MVRIPTHRTPTHPGEMLIEEFLKPMKISAYRLSKETKMHATRISEILKGRRRITADTALRLSKFFGTSADFWMGLQIEYDLREERKLKAKVLATIRSYESLQVNSNWYIGDFF